MGVNRNNPWKVRSKSYLIDEGRLTKVDGTANANAENVAFTNNVLMDLFTSTKYQISDQVTDFLFYSDQGTIMLGLL